MAWTSMTQALTPEVVPAWRYVYPLVRFFQKRADPAKAAQVCVRLAWDASPAEINGRYFTERGKPGKLPASVVDPALQRTVLRTAENLAQHAPTAVIWGTSEEAVSRDRPDTWVSPRSGRGSRYEWLLCEVLFALHGRPVADRAVEPSLLVPVKPGEDRRSDVRAGGEVLAVDDLALESAPVTTA
jgi:hypothetical protein